MKNKSDIQNHLIRQNNIKEKIFDFFNSLTIPQEFAHILPAGSKKYFGNYICNIYDIVTAFRLSKEVENLEKAIELIYQSGDTIKQSLNFVNSSDYSTRVGNILGNLLFQVSKNLSQFQHLPSDSDQAISCVPSLELSAALALQAMEANPNSGLLHQKFVDDKYNAYKMASSDLSSASNPIPAQMPDLALSKQPQKINSAQYLSSKEKQQLLELFGVDADAEIEFMAPAVQREMVTTYKSMIANKIGQSAENIAHDDLLQNPSYQDQAHDEPVLAHGAASPLSNYEYYDDSSSDILDY